MKRVVALVLVAMAVAFMPSVGCAGQQVHVFSAWTYDPDRDCLETPTVVDVLQGPDDGPCEQLRCWESPGHQLYVTDTACGGPPDFKNETNDKNSLCTEALDVYGRVMHGECPDAGVGGAGGGGVL